MKRIGILLLVFCTCFVLAAWPQGTGQYNGAVAWGMSGTAAATETILHSFTCGESDGCDPASGVIFGPDGSLYGTAVSGGAYGAGVVFRLSPSGTLTVVHSFNPSKQDGFAPMSGVVFAPDGNLYGTTEGGGSSYAGTVYKVTPSGTETVIHNFSSTDGCNPQATMVADSEDNLYGTTSGCGEYGGGTVFKLNPLAGIFKTLYSFTGGNDGGSPSGLVLDTEGNLYGTTNQGGSHGFGTVFKISPSGTEKVLHSFNANGEDGFYPEGGVVLSSKGNLFGTTDRGGTVGVGTVFEVAANGTEKILYSFKAGADGISAAGGLVLVGSDGACGVTIYGGTVDLGTVFCGSTSSSGTVTETVLHSFSHNGKDGYLPQGALAIDKSGNLYGTAANGGKGGCGVYGCGVVFKIVPPAPY